MPGVKRKYVWRRTTQAIGQQHTSPVEKGDSPTKGEATETENEIAGVGSLEWAGGTRSYFEDAS